MARSSSRETIWLTFTPGAGSNSKVVTTGPGWISVTCPCTSKSASLEVSRLASTVRSSVVTMSSICKGIESRLSEGSASVGTSRGFSAPAAAAGLGLARQCVI